jgi:hypothetical protein
VKIGLFLGRLFAAQCVSGWLVAPVQKLLIIAAITIAFYMQLKTTGAYTESISISPELMCGS